MPFLEPRRQVWVEVHTALLSDHTAARDRVFCADCVARQSVPMTFRGYRTNRLDAELELAYTCTHWALERGCLVGGVLPLVDVIYLVLPGAQKHPVGWSEPILRGLLDRYAMQGRPFGGLASESSVRIVWNALLAPRSAAQNLLSVPWNVLFPPGNPRRFSPGFQLRRLTGRAAPRS